MRIGWLLLGLFWIVGPSLPPAAPEEEAERLVGRVRVQGDGFVRLSAEALRGLGIEHPLHASVTRRGRGAPVCFASEREGVVFLALGTASARSRIAVYEIGDRGAPASAIPLLATDVLDASTPSSVVPVTRVVSDDRYFGQLPIDWQDPSPPDAPTWFAFQMPPGGQVHVPFDVGRAVGDQTVRAHVFSTHRGHVNLYGRLGSRHLGISRSPSGAYGGAWFTWRTDADAPRGLRWLFLHDRTETLPARPALGFARRRGWLWIDEVRIEGDVEATLDHTARAYPVPASRSLVLGLEPPEDEFFGHPGRTARCVHLDAEDRVLGAARVALGTARRAAVRVAPGTAAGRILASTQVRVLAPEPARRIEDPSRAVGAARHVIVAVPALVEPARALARHRTKQGLPSAVVDVTDLYGAYSHGARDPEAIRELVRRLRAREDAPLDYLVLAGDATHDRTDGSAWATIPALMARTQYNGATPSDWLYVVDRIEDLNRAPAVGRLPFRRPEVLRSYVERLIAYETSPPTGPERRMMRFVAGRSNMDQQLDRYFELAFSRILQLAVPLHMDVEVTYAYERSPWYWPLEELSRKIVEDVNRGSLFLTYVGHGFVEGFIEEQAFDMGGRVFELADARSVAIRGTPPIFMVFACSTAAFDLLHGPCIGEVLLAGPQGPLAYYGASRVCHPAFHILAGFELAIAVGRSERARMGQVIQRAIAETLAPTSKEGRAWRNLVQGMARGVRVPGVRSLDFGLAVRDGLAMYQLLGDPALRIALPHDDLDVRVALDADAGAASVTTVAGANLPDGLEVHVTLERERATNPPGVAPAADPTNPARYAEVRRRHRMANNVVLAATTGRLAAGRAQVRLEIPEEGAQGPRVVKVWLVHGTDVHVGAVVLPTGR